MQWCFTRVCHGINSLSIVNEWSGWPTRWQYFLVYWRRETNSFTFRPRIHETQLFISSIWSAKNKLRLTDSKSSHTTIGHRGFPLELQHDPNGDGSFVHGSWCIHNKFFAPTLKYHSTVKNARDVLILIHGSFKKLPPQRISLSLWLTGKACLISSEMCTTLRNCRDLRDEWLRDFKVLVMKQDLKNFIYSLYRTNASVET